MAMTQAYAAAHVTASRAGTLLYGIPVSRDVRAEARRVAEARGISVQSLVTQLVHEAAQGLLPDVDRDGAA